MNTIEQKGDLETFLAIMTDTLTEFEDDTVTELFDGAFRENEHLENVILPNLEKIQGGAFAYTSLKTINFPKITSIASASSAFSYCSSLESVTFENAVSSIPSSMFTYCRALQSVSIPHATSIGSNAFLGCSALSEVSFPEATSIDGHAFASDSALETVYFPQATRVGNGAFYACRSIEQITLPAVTNLTGEPFSDCTSLISISLPAFTNYQKTGIYDTLFRNCTALTDIYVSFSETHELAASAPWGAVNATVHYNTTFDEDGNPVT
jgi:hypothetical protein